MKITGVEIRIKQKIKENSWWYRNCKTQRRKEAKICSECPIREIIESFEKTDITILDIVKTILNS